MLVRDLTIDQQSALEALRKDIESLYRSVKNAYLDDWRIRASKENLTDDCPDSVRKVEKACEVAGLGPVARYYPVESNYYDWPLQQRAFRLLAPSAAHMCKSVIMENRAYDSNMASDPNYARYYCVMTQYIAPVNTQKLMHFARSLSNKAVSKKYYNFRLAQPEVSLELTGFHKGGVSPIGMNQPIPIILAEAITKLEPPVMFIGAGHIDWKLGLPVKEFIESTGCMIVDLE